MNVLIILHFTTNLYNRERELLKLKFNSFAYKYSLAIDSIGKLNDRCRIRKHHF